MSNCGGCDLDVPIAEYVQGDGPAMPLCEICLAAYRHYCKTRPVFVEEWARRVFLATCPTCGQTFSGRKDR